MGGGLANYKLNFYGKMLHYALNIRNIIEKCQDYTL
jgi:hypothetical protein